MKTNLSVEIKPFEAPSVVSVYVPDTGCDCVSPHVTSLSPQDLDRLCAEFRARVFEKACADLPPEAEAPPQGALHHVPFEHVAAARDALSRLQEILREMLDAGVSLGDCQALTQSIGKVLLQL